MWRRVAPALVLVLLAPFVGEVLLGSVPTHFLYAYPALVPMYGGGALLVRELTRRSGRGGLTLLLLAAAYGVVEEGLGDMSLFNPNFLGLHLLARGNLFGIGWVWWLDVLTLHVVWSIGASVLLAEALFARRGTAPWLGRVGLVVAGVAFALGTALVHAAAGEGYVLSAAQLAGALGLILALVATAFLLPRPRGWPPADGPRPDPRRDSRRAPRPWLVGVAAFVPASAFMALDPRVSGALRLPALGAILADVVLYLLAASTIARWSRRRGWGGTQRFALAAGAALTYTWCGLVFTGRNVLDLAGQVVVALLAIGLLAVAARRTRAALTLPTGFALIRGKTRRDRARQLHVAARGLLAPQRAAASYPREVGAVARAAGWPLRRCVAGPFPGAAAVWRPHRCLTTGKTHHGPAIHRRGLPAQPSLRRALRAPNVVRPHAGALRALHVDPRHGTGINWHLPGNPHRYPLQPPERSTMTQPAPRIDYANLPAPAEGFVVTLFITVRKVARSRDFYSRVLGGTVVLYENPCMVKLSNSWIIMNPGGPPTPDKPGISVVDYQPGDTTSIFLNLRVADIQACYEEWKAKGAEFVTPPIDRGAEIRCYMRDPDGYLIEVGQSTGLLHGKLAAKRPEDLPG